MSLAGLAEAPIGRTDRFFIGGQWVVPSSGATIDVVDSATEEVYFRVAQAQAADMSRAVAAAREAFDEGPWPRLTPAERAGYLRAIGAELRLRGEDIAEIWPRESGVLYTFAAHSGTGAEATFKRYAASRTRGACPHPPFAEPDRVGCR